MAKTNNPWHIAPGINNVGSFQVSGAPYVTSSIRAHDGAVRLQLPSVTRWVQFINYDTTASCKVGFSALGLGIVPYSEGGGDVGYHYGHNFFLVPSSSHAQLGRHADSGILEWKVGEIWLEGSSDMTVMAGLTNIKPQSCSGSSGPSWSGSSGVG